MIWNALQRYQDHGLLILRLGVGAGFFWYHGLPKLQGGPEQWANVGGAMGNFGITFSPAVWGLLAALTESLGAIFFAAGFLFRPVALVLAFVMLAATINHWVTGVGNPAHSFKNFWVLVGLSMVGPGRFSVDHMLQKKREQSAPTSPPGSR